MTWTNALSRFVLHRWVQMSRRRGGRERRP